MPVGAINSINENSKNYSSECFASTAELLRPKKKAKLAHLSSITLGYLASRKGSRKSKHWKRVRILLDSGCGATLINESLIKNLKTTKDKKNGQLKLESSALPVNAK